MGEGRGRKTEGRRRGLGVTLLCSVSVNLAELRRVLMCEGLNVALLCSVSVNLAELRRVLMCEGLNVALLCSVSVNLAELRRAQTRVGKED